MKLRSCFAILAAAALAGCNQYSTPGIQRASGAAGGAEPPSEGASDRSVNSPNSQADPTETTGSLGGSPGGTSSAQTAPSSSNGVR